MKVLSDILSEASGPISTVYGVNHLCKIASVFHKPENELKSVDDFLKKCAAKMTREYLSEDKTAMLPGIMSWYLKNRVLGAPSTWAALTRVARLAKMAPTLMAWKRTMPEFQALLSNAGQAGTAMQNVGFTSPDDIQSVVQ